MKKIILIMLTIMLVFSSGVVFAEEWEQEITVTYNGELIDFEVSPQIINDRTMVPFRAIFETLGGVVDFDGETRTVSSEFEGKKLSFVIGEYEAVLETPDGKEIIPIDSPPVIVNDYTLIPVRFVAESSGLKVNWDEHYREVVIIDTNAWKRTISEKSPFIKKLIEMPLSEFNFDNISESTATFDVEIGLLLENAKELYGEGETGPENIDLNISLNIKNEEWLSKKNAMAKSAITLDLSSLGNLIKQTESQLSFEDLDVISKLLKLHNFNIEVILDEDKNIYLKSVEIIDLINDLGGEDVAQMVGDNYVKIPYPAKNIVDLKSPELWSYVEMMVEKDETMTTHDVIMIEYILGAIGDLYSKDSVTVEDKTNGGYKVTFDVNQEDYFKMSTNLIDKIWECNGLNEAEKQFVEEQKKEMLKDFEKIDMAIKGYIDAKDAVNYSYDLKSYIKVNDLLIPDTENVSLSLSLDINLKAMSKETVKAKNIQIPENAVEILQ